MKYLYTQMISVIYEDCHSVIVYFNTNCIYFNNLMTQKQLKQNVNQECSSLRLNRYTITAFQNILNSLDHLCYPYTVTWTNIK